MAEELCTTEKSFMGQVNIVAGRATLAEGAVREVHLEQDLWSQWCITQVNGRVGPAPRASLR